MKSRPALKGQSENPLLLMVDQEFCIRFDGQLYKDNEEGSVSVWFNTSGLDSNAVILKMDLF